MSYNIKGVDSAVYVTKQATKNIGLKDDSVRFYKRDHSIILKQNDQEGPIIFHLDKREWVIVQAEF